MGVEPEVARGRMWQSGTLPRAGAMALLLGAMLLFLSWLSPDRAPPTDVDRYLRRGEVAGAEALRADLVRLSPQGTDSGPAVQHLIALGFNCVAPMLPNGSWSCLHRRPAEGRVLRSFEARVRLDRGSTAEITTRIWDEPIR
ncbi:hypothetical protein [Roseococcus thiosulfatophilus]|uniref:hypothetical protein n=1 Tax=Roseococcus thiosulfatophilus TaxID=35813 RepID=UPI001A8EF157|nr:hypothetical protein [Roseococcus thiosulfatophilus]